VCEKKQRKGNSKTPNDLLLIEVKNYCRRIEMLASACIKCTKSATIVQDMRVTLGGMGEELVGYEELFPDLFFPENISKKNKHDISRKDDISQERPSKRRRFDESSMM
jgi:hypothetical protein